MAQTPRRSQNRSANGLRPVQDSKAAKQAAQFPSVGMTLRSYKYDPTDSHGSPRGGVVTQSRFRRFRQKFRLKRTALVLAALVVLVGGWLGFKFIYNAHKLFGGSILGVLSSTKLDGENKGRVTILLAGNSADDVGHNGAQLTDSIMVMSIDTRNHKAFLLSVPRDLWVNIPNEGHAKINETYPDGETDKFSDGDYPEGGMGLLEKVIEDNLGIDINYYALVNYNALRDGVDAVGGVDFTVASKDPRGLYDPNIDYSTHGPLVKLTNGVHHLNGQQALDLSRARGDSYRSYGFPGSDFDRTEHQRQLLVALKSKAVTAGVITNPAKLSKLSDAIGNNVKTDFKLDEVKRLYALTKDINSNNIKSLSFNDNGDGQSLLASYTSRSGQSALIPAVGLDDFSDIQTFINRQTSSDPIVQEGAKVVLLNGTDVTGLASKQKLNLVSKHIIVSKVSDADSDQPTTTIIDNSLGKKPSTRQALINAFGSAVTTTNPYANRYDADFIVIVGGDKIPPAAAKTTQ